MLAIEKALFVSLCSGLNAGYRWRTRLAERVPDERVPATVLLDGRQLAELQALYRQNDEDAVAIVRSLEERADAILEEPVVRITDKPKVAGDESPNDYRSLAKYWWPDPDSTNGLPYVRRDGEVNPECYDERYDTQRTIFLAESLQILSLATWFTGKTAYRERAVAQLQAWFIEPESRQSPHFRFAQNVPGHGGLQSQGLIEARHLIYVTESVLLLESVEALPASLSAGLREWFRELLAWFRESDKGIGAGKAHNNIALWYDLQCLAYAWFVGDDALAQHIVTHVAVVRREDQVELDGSLPAELDRANPMDYVTFTLAAMSQLSRYGDAMGVPIWRQADGDGRSFQKAYDWLLLQHDARESREAGHGLLIEAAADEPRKGDPLAHEGDEDLVLQLGLLSRLADARRRMLEARDIDNKRQTTRVSELERELASRDKQLKTLKQKQGQDTQRDMENEKQANARLERLEKELIRTREARIQDLQNVIQRHEQQARDDDKQRALQQKVEDHKQKLVKLETRFQDAQRQFDTQLAEVNEAKGQLASDNERLERELKQQLAEHKRLEQDAKQQRTEKDQLKQELKRLRADKDQLKAKQGVEAQKAKEKEKRFSDLLKTNEQELERLLKAFRERPAVSEVDDSQHRAEIKKLKQEIRSQQRKVGRLQESVDRQRSRADYFKDRSDKILSSRSWRLTGALRKLTGSGSGKKR